MTCFPRITFTHDHKLNLKNNYLIFDCTYLENSCSNLYDFYIVIKEISSKKCWRHQSSQTWPFLRNLRTFALRELFMFYSNLVFLSGGSGSFFMNLDVAAKQDFPVSDTGFSIYVDGDMSMIYWCKNFLVCQEVITRFGREGGGSLGIVFKTQFNDQYCD